jgi:hypothetical protein
MESPSAEVSPAAVALRAAQIAEHLKAVDQEVPPMRNRLRASREEKTQNGAGPEERRAKRARITVDSHGLEPFLAPRPVWQPNRNHENSAFPD